jgi:hypothetical protein
LLEDSLKDIEDKLETQIETILQRYIVLNKACLSTNGSLIKKALKAQLIQEEKFEVLEPILIGHYVLV